MSQRERVKPTFAYVGCVTTEKRKARGKGVAVYRIDPADGIWRFVQACDYIHNPHYVALDRTQYPRLQRRFASSI